MLVLGSSTITREQRLPKQVLKHAGNSDGKEVRFPVILTLREKEIARRIVLVFRQFVCGFDLLRVQVGPQVSRNERDGRLLD
jgi:hypothetical protein